MTFDNVNDQPSQASAQILEPARRSTELSTRYSILPWVASVGLGTFLGIFVAHVFDLPPRVVPLVIAAVLFPFLAAIVGGMRKLLLAAVIIDIAITLDANLGYREDVAQLGALGGLSIGVTAIALAGLYALWLSELLVRLGYRPRPWFSVSLTPILFFAFVALSALVARDVTLSSFTIALVLQLLLLYIYVVGTVRTREEVLFIVTILLSILLAESLLMILLYFVRHNVSIAGIAARIDYEPTGTGLAYRVGGTIGSPNTAAGFLSLLLPLAICVLLTPLGRGYKLLATFAFCFGSLALVLTFSRGGWGALLLSIAIVFFFAWQQGRLSRKVPGLLAAALILLAIFFPGPILARLTLDDLGSAAGRVPLMQIAWKMISDHPLLGVGANNFAVAMKEYLTPDFSQAWIYVVHNRYLLIWAESGIGAFGAFVAFLLVTIRRGWKSWRLEDPLLSPLALGLMAAVIGHMYHMTVEVFNGRPDQQLFYLIASLITVIYCLGREKSPQV